MEDYSLYHAIRANLLQRAGRSREAIHAYETVIARAGNGAERQFLERKRSYLEERS